MRKLLIGMAAFALGATSANAVGSCTLTLTTSGKLTMSGDGMSISSLNTGGLSAVMAVVSLNLTPQLIFSPLSIVGPTGWAGSPITYQSLKTLSGTNIPFTNTGFSVNVSPVADTLTIDARVVNTSGFKAGSYNASTTITCQAA
ncbi:hypothetical protein HL653_12805 [Sphingomonas sp. AP4-R1]|uniref:hypothetical protein n=1 Tax=Sphingomonas sp. AP4-R1 TaxID=2735134 RepID=UPI0014936F58|nr:hypothetical protein [Sphingomonas sp. AP4-R1]QJU58526.1 hypothetical protein HL653_12805 [Sphingomonas sp. AP4-R1]